MALRKRPASEMNFEDSLQKLEAIVKRLEEEEVPLETSLKLFAEGQTLAQACEQQLRAAENQIRQLLEKGSGKIEETAFEESDDDETGEKPEEPEEDDESTPEKPPQDPPPAAPEKPARSRHGEKDSPAPDTHPRPADHGLDELPF